MTAAVLHREAFRTSRLLEFCNQKELTAQTGHAPEEWPVVILKELVDNALDAAEEANIAAEIEIKVSTKTGEIVVADNGPGVPCETVKHVLDYSVRVSSREAYVNPTRGAQGNALKTLVAMPFALDGTCGDVVIEAEGVAHRIGFAVDQLRQEPRIIYETGPSDVKSGTCVMVNWPDSACSILDDAKDRFLQIAEDFAWLNPHTRVRVEWNSVTHIDRSPSDPGWKKWRACDPTSAHWYDLARLERYIAAHVSRDRDHGRARTVRDFITEFRGFSGSRKQKVVLEETGLARASLSSLFGGGGEPKRTEIELLLDALKKHSKPVKPGDLGLIGQDHLLARFKETGVDERTFKYQKVLGGADDGLPWTVETAFGWCPKEINQRRIIAGVNWSVGLGNPFRSFGRHGGEGLESILAEQRAGRTEPIAFVLHVACPRIEYTDRGKPTIVIPEEPAMTNASSPAQGIKVAVQGVTRDWAKQRKAEERRARSSSTRSHYLVRIRSISIKEAAYRVMEKAYMAASDNGRLPVKPRQIMYAARPSILELTGKDHLDDTYFTQTLLPDYIEEHDDDAWDIVWDARGTFVEPHSNLPIPLGTLEVRQYLGARPDFREKDDGADIDFTINSRFSNLGPEDRYRTVLYIEKEGFGALLKSVRIAERFDLACMSNKGMSVTATRMLLDRLVERGVDKVFVLRDFDVSGFSIAGTIATDSRRYTFDNKVPIVDLGLRLVDVEAMGLLSEPAPPSKNAWSRVSGTLERHGATPNEIAFLHTRRVELNAMTSRQFIDFLEAKFKEHGVKKVVPDDKVLERHARGMILQQLAKKELKKIRAAIKRQAAETKLPDDLRQQVEAKLENRPSLPRDEAVAAVVQQIP